MIFQKSAFRKSYRFFVDLGANMRPFSFPKSIKIFPEVDPKMHQFFDWFLHRFLIDVGSILKANLEPCHQIFLPRAVQNGPQHPPKATKTAKSLKNLENDPQNPMGYPFGLRFCSQHGCIWGHFGEDFWTYFVYFFQDFTDAFGLIRASAVAGSLLCGALNKIWA